MTTEAHIRRPREALDGSLLSLRCVLTFELSGDSLSVYRTLASSV